MLHIHRWVFRKWAFPAEVTNIFIWWKSHCRTHIHQMSRENGLWLKPEKCWCEFNNYLYKCQKFQEDKRALWNGCYNVRVFAPTLWVKIYITVKLTALQTAACVTKEWWWTSKVAIAKAPQPEVFCEFLWVYFAGAKKSWEQQKNVDEVSGLQTQWSVINVYYYYNYCYYLL